MKAVVIVHSGGSLESFYEGVLKSVDARFHNYQTTFPRYHTSEGEYGELETAANFAQHAGDKRSGPPPGTHIERWLA